MSDSPTVAVVGATGRQGAAVARVLLERGAAVRALTRSADGEAAKALAAEGASLVEADPSDPDSVRAAFDGVDAAYLMTTRSTDDETALGTTYVDAAVAAGVPYVVYSSVGGAERDTGIPHFETKWAIEGHLAETDLPATVIRPVFFMDNLSPSVEDGELVVRLALPGDVPLQMITPEDIGRVAASALLDRDAVPGGAVEIGGSEQTGDEIAAAYAAHTGLPARYEAVPLDALDDDDSRRMFAWFDSGSAYDADFGLSRALAERDGGPPPADVAAWLERTEFSPGDAG